MALVELAVENLAVIERIRLSLAPGFTVLTGETGAGKSLLVDALALALGERASADQVRTGTDAARIEAIFDGIQARPDDPLAELLEAGDGLAILRREVNADGRSLARVNDRTVTVGSLAALGAQLAEIHGQHDQQRLLQPDRQLALLDRFGGLVPGATAVASAFRAWRSTRAEASELLVDAHELARRVELLSHEAEEIASAALRPGEDEELEQKLRGAAHAEAVARSADTAVRALADEGGGLDALRVARSSIAAAAAHDDRFGELLERSRSLEVEASELARDAGALGEAVALDPGARAAAEERLSRLYDLKRKYGEAIEDVQAYGRSAEAELARLQDQEGLRARLRADEERLRAELEAAATALRVDRLRTATELAERVNAELPPLGLPAGAFGIAVGEVEIGATGGDRVDFTFAPNPGEPARPLGRIASGGEASRLSLALKVVLASADETPVLIFDEVDAGVGGRNGSALGERLRALAAYHQVLCVTHLAQVAAFADAHLHIGKQVVDGRTLADATLLDAAGRRRELAAMLAGEAAGAEAQAAADALLRAAAE
jgi:DNA repair protein RecN (Recombination protein N)